MKICKRCKEPTKEFPLTKHGKRSTMCEACTAFTKARNQRKLDALRTSMANPPEGMKVCRRCMKPKPIGEFEPNPGACFRYRNATSCKSCREYAAEKAIAYRAAHPDDRRQKDMKAKSTAAAKCRAELLAAYGGMCVCCGESEWKFLQLDHVNDDGRAHRKSIGLGVYNLLRWAKDNGFPPTLQILCANCHNAKSFYGECPHKSSATLSLHQSEANSKETGNAAFQRQ
jgi:hypothetical protein